MLIRSITSCILLLTVICDAIAEQAFPLRSVYSNVPTISLEQFTKEFNNVIIVDVRSNYEYKIIHIQHALNNPISYYHFIHRLLLIRSKDSAKKVVFYCNGETCSKSYRATRKAIAAGFNNVYAFDAGVFKWAKTNPLMTRLMDQPPSATNRLIDKEEFAKHLLTYAMFLKKSAEYNSIVIDIREPIQRRGDLSLVSIKLYLDKLESRLKRGKWKNRQLLIYDAVGKQVRWLQYYLVKYGYKNYYFLEHGMLAKNPELINPAMANTKSN